MNADQRIGVLFGDAASPIASVRGKLFIAKFVSRQAGKKGGDAITIASLFLRAVGKSIARH